MSSNSRLNPFGLTVALDESGSAIGELFYDEGDLEHIMAETLLIAFTFDEVNTEEGEDEFSRRKLQFYI